MTGSKAFQFNPPAFQSTFESSVMTQDPATIRLDNFLKLTGAVGTGGQAKLLIQDGQVLVNGEIETRRRRQLTVGDEVELEGDVYEVQHDE